MELPSNLMEKWEPILNGENVAPIKDAYRKRVTAIVLENMQRESASERGALNETVPANFSAGLGGTSANTSGIDAYDPILISLVRRSLPNLMAFDVCGVQPMSGPTGMIFAMKALAHCLNLAYRLKRWRSLPGTSRG